MLEQWPEVCECQWSAKAAKPRDTKVPEELFIGSSWELTELNHLVIQQVTGGLDRDDFSTML